MKNVAIITARGGSKRIPRKNIKNFMGKPMIFYAINAACESKLFDAIMVSTEDDEIAEISKNYGADIPFKRSEKNADDYAGTQDILLEVIDEYKKREIVFDNICCIYPCVPFLTGEILKDAYNKFIKSDADRLTPVVKFSFPIQRAFKIKESGLLEPREPENFEKRSQDLELMYHDVGMFYFFKQGKIMSKNIIPYEMDETNIQDIDNISDWKMAEIKYKVLHNV